MFTKYGGKNGDTGATNDGGKNGDTGATNDGGKNGGVGSGVTPPPPLKGSIHSPKSADHTRPHCPHWLEFSRLVSRHGSVATNDGGKNGLATNDGGKNGEATNEGGKNGDTGGSIHSPNSEDQTKPH
jgi:hypothetical protein